MIQLFIVHIKKGAKRCYLLCTFFVFWYVAGKKSYWPKIQH